MTVKLMLDKELVAQAKRLGRHKTEREAVHAALNQYVDRVKQLQVVELFGTVDFYPGCDHKPGRSR